MGSGPVDSAGFSSHKNYTDIFEESFPYLLSIGMTYEQFWYKDPHLVRDYLKAEDLRRKRKNEEMWLQGLYVYNAIGAFAEILPAFPKRGARVKSYIEEPVSITKAEAEAKAERERVKKIEAIKNRMFAIAYSSRKENEVS